MAEISENARIRELEAEVEHLRNLVHRDPLTGALNRRGFETEANLFFRAVRYGREHPEHRRSINIESFSILFIDIDDFKKLNDLKGHDTGDRALQKVIEAIGHNVRYSDLIGRWGGEELVVGLVGANEDDGWRLAEKIRADVVVTAGVTVSIGVAELTGEWMNLEGVIARADKAMYVAKHDRGKNSVVRYSEINH